MIEILVAADVRLYREGLVEVLGRCDEINVLGMASNSFEVLVQLSEHAADVVLLDMAMPESFTAARRIAEGHPEVNVVALGIPEIESEVIACAEAGIAGYVARDGSLADLLEAVRGAVEGELTCSPRIARGLLRRVAVLAAERPAEDEPALLTPRETQVARLLERGLSNKEIAQELCIEVSTVKNHVHNILDRLQVQRRGEAAARLRAAPRPRSLVAVADQKIQTPVQPDPAEASPERSSAQQTSRT
jgi:DNA-binding NarL/FixJ family response regulator